ncbi:DNA polymerase III alpha subunit [Chitinispirillum alkaliphilum]|nr:DNA polymerase III alpha subunit [Chitinispirillum alkaliphilum]
MYPTDLFKKFTLQRGFVRSFSPFCCVQGLMLSMSVLLSVVSNFSLLRGVLSPEQICRRAKELSYTAVALTDTDNLYGLPEFLSGCRDYGLRAIIASQLSCSAGTVLLYARGNDGYRNLCRIISEKHCSEKFDIHESIKKDSSGLCGVSNERQVISSLHGILPLYYRITSLKAVPAWVKELNMKSLVIPQAVFSHASQYQTHRLLRAISLNTTLSALSSDQLFPCDALMRSPQQIYDRFEVFEEALQTTRQFGENLFSRDDFGQFIMPVFPDSHPNSAEVLRKKAFEGAKWRYGELSEAVVKRLGYELELIESKGFCDYFLVVDDIVKQSPRTCGRGSGAASIVAFCLGITNVDPIRYNLMFERFLNPGRTDPPDIDIDFAWDERDEVLRYVFERYGEEHTAMIATHQTFGTRMAIRETARVYGCTEQEISDVTRKIPWFAQLCQDDSQLEDELRSLPVARDLSLDPPWPQILSEAKKIIGMPSGIGTHCGGVVITPGPIREMAPVQYSAKGFPIVQWEKDGAEAMGLVKIDLLGNRSLAVIRDAIANIQEEGVEFDENSWDPQSDPQTMDLFARGESMGVFYVESPAMRLLQKKSGRGDFEHLVIHSSIIRPAANAYIRKYLERLHGASFEVLHPVFKEVLSETFGIMVYQEDVSRVAMALAGFSSEDADMLRKIVSKKARNRRFEDYKQKFFHGAAARGVSKSIIQEIWNMMLSFSGYSFCKPHSASYVQVSFQSAYLKVHYPASFMAAVLSNYGGYYSTQAYISEAMRLGIKVFPPDVNLSQINYRAAGNTLFVGLCQIKGLTHNAQNRIVERRRCDGPYRDMTDFMKRTNLDETDMERLLYAGAFDNLCRNINRSQQFWQMRSFYLGGRSGGSLPGLKPLTQAQYLSYQYKTIGFLTPHHPVTYVRYHARNSCIKIGQIDGCLGKMVTFLGWCITSKTVFTKTGDDMVFVTFEDESGLCEGVLFPDVYKRYAWLIAHHTVVLVKGKVTEEFGVKTVEISWLGRVRRVERLRG